MKKQLVGFILPFLICVLMPLGAIAATLVMAASPWPLDPGDSTTFTVTAKENGSPVVGQTVTFSVSPDDGTVSLSVTSTTTDSNGKAQTVLRTGSGSSGSYTVTATVGSSSVSGTATVEGSPPPPPPPPPPELSISVVSGPGSGDPGDALTFTVEVQEDGSAASGKTVTFSITSGDGNASLNPPSATTNSSGQASTTLTLGNSASGSYTITATVGSKSTSGTATVEASPPPPPPPLRTLVMFSSPWPLDPGDITTFTVEVQEDGSAASGKTVTFSVSPDDGTASLSPTSATTDSNGQAQTILITGSGSSGSYTVTATVGSSSVSSTATVEGSPPPPELSISVVSGPGSGAPGETLTFAVEVQEDGSPASGKTVTFSITSGDSNASLGTTSTTTGSNGRASTTLILGNSASGSYTITASSGSKSTSGTATVNTPPPPPPPLRSLVMTSSPWPLDPSGSMTFTVTVQDDGSPVQDQTVTFSVSPDDGTVSLSATSTTTDSSGQAQTTLTTGSSSSGSYTVTATVGSSSVTSTVEVLSSSQQQQQDDQGQQGQQQQDQQDEQDQQELPPPPPEPTALSIISGDSQSGLTGKALTDPFVVEVRDQNNDPVEGVTVTSTVTTGDGTLSTMTAMTDANGQAEITLTLGGEPGTNTVDVSVEGITETVTFNAEASLPPPMPIALSIISGDNQNGMTGEALTDPFVVEVRDQYGAPMEGVTVPFTVSAGDGTLSTITAMTDVNGQAEIILTLGSEPGTNTVDVSVEGITETATFNAVAKLLEFDLSLSAGYNLIHVPLKVRTVDGIAVSIESIGDLYDALGGTNAVSLLITVDSQTQEWSVYFSPSDRGTPADKPLTDDMGILADMRTSALIRLSGAPLGTNGNSVITLNPGYNIVGVPLKDSSLTHVSDLFTLEGIGGNAPVAIFTDNGAFKAVTPAGGPDDIEITGEQAFILDVQRAATVAISGDGWTNISGMAAAPPVAMGGIEVADITPILALRGSIVDERGLNNTNFRVTVKNRTTGRSVATITRGEYPSPTDKWGSAGVGYQLADVDLETKRAAMIGDILEISAQSSHPLISVEPLQYTVTVEDIRQGWIQLPALVAYEIPAETALLHNYPNPFNPETWIPYQLAHAADVTLTIYDTQGILVRQLDLGHQQAGYYTNRTRAAHWDGRNHLGEAVGSGVYFYHLHAGDYSAIQKMVILK